MFDTLDFVRALVTLLMVAGCDRVFALSTVHGEPEQVDASGTGDDSTADAAMCPRTYNTVLATGVYRVSTGVMTWSEAEADCEHDGIGALDRTHLLVLTSQAELDQVKLATGALDVWVGLTDQAFEGSFRWVTTEDPQITWLPASGPPWGTNEPNDAQNREDCAAVRSSGVLNDFNCDQVINYVCECDAFPVP